MGSRVAGPPSGSGDEGPPPLRGPPPESAFSEDERGATADDPYGLFFVAGPIPMWIFDVETLRFVDVNEEAIRQYGYTREEFLRMTIRDIRPPEDVPALEAAVKAAGMGSHHGVWRHRKKDGTLIHAEVTTRGFRIGGRRVALVFAKDVSAQRRAEEALARSERKFRTLFEAAADAILLIDPKGEILDANPAGAVLLGDARDRLVGRNLSEFIPPEDLERARAYLRDLLRERPVREPFDITIRRSGVPPRSLEVNSRVVREDGSKYLEVIARDVTENRELARRVLDAEIGSALVDFAMFVAHQLSTPLTSMALIAGQLERRVTDPEVRERIERIDRQRRLATSLISSLQRFSRYRSLSFEDFDLREALEVAIEQVIPFRKEGVALNLNAPVEPVVVHGDAVLLREVFVNLIKNALQATSRGSVQVLVARSDDAVRVEVTDTGDGIPQDVLEKLFQSFFTTKPLDQGTGLGLAFCRLVLLAHGGTIDVTSEVGRGSTFRVTIPKRP